MESMEVFLALLERGEEYLDFPMAWACLTSALTGSGDPNTMLKRLADLKAEAGEYVESNISKTPNRLECFNSYFTKKARFQGNQASYLDPRNSYLDHLLDRRLGIPISLSMIYQELGNAAGLEIEPVNFPGHFLVRDSSADILCDPFTGRIHLSQSECLSIASKLFGGDVMWSEEFLRTATPFMVLERFLNNFRNSFSSNGDKDRLKLVESIFERFEEIEMRPIQNRAIH